MTPLELARAGPTGLAALASRGTYARPRHLALLERALLRAAHPRGGARILVSMPPRHGKSELVSRWFPAWFLGTYPDRRVILASYEANFAASWGAKARGVLAKHGPEVFGVHLNPSASAADAWLLRDHEGGMWTAGVGGAITGKGAELLIVDDPVKNHEEAASQTYRNKTWEWWRTTARTRVEPGGSIIVVQTRWHEDDLTGRLLEAQRSGEGEAWEQIVLPCRAEANDPLGRPEGAALWPERWPLASLTPSHFGSYTWAALYQQRPSPAGGGLFKRESFRYFSVNGDFVVPDGGAPIGLGHLRRFATVDLAVTVKTTSDWTVTAVWGQHKASLFLLDLVRFRAEGPDLAPRIKQVAVERWRCSAVFVESNAFQAAIVQEARRQGVPVIEAPVDKDKFSRALPAAAMVEGGLMRFRSGAPWLDALEHELVAFPNGAHDDQVDTLSAAAEARRRFGGGVLGEIPVPREAETPRDLLALTRPPGW